MFRVGIQTVEDVTIGLIVLLKGVYPQSEGGLAIVDIDASKGFVNLWVHLSFAILLLFSI